MKFPGNSIVVPNHISSLCLSILDPFDPNYVIVESDHLGMIPESLELALKGCNEKTPKALYVNPSGCDPTGVTIPLERRKKIYRICCDYDLLLIEDDPDYLMRYDVDDDDRSFLSLDSEGRVLRVDSLWSVVGEGMRIGFVTGPKPIVKVLELHTQVQVMHEQQAYTVVCNFLMLLKC